MVVWSNDMRFFFAIILFFLAGISQADNCPDNNLAEETRCRLELLKDTEKIFNKHLNWLKEVDNHFAKMIKEEAACRGFKELYPTISSSDAKPCVPPCSSLTIAKCSFFVLSI